MDSNETCDPVEIFQHLRWRSPVISFALLQLTTGFVATVANFIVIVAFFLEKEIERRKINIYIISLAFADFFVGFIGIPFGSVVMIWASQKSEDLPPLCHDLLCLVPMCITMACSNISIFSLVMISIKRLGILTNNFPNLKSSKNITKEILFSWILGIIIGFLPVFWNNKKDNTCIIYEVMPSSYHVFRFSFVVIIPAMILVYVYVKIYRIITEQKKKKLEREMKKTWKSLTNADDATNQKWLDKEIRVTISIAIIVVLFWSSWIPLQIFYLIINSCKTCIPKPLIAFNVWFIQLNSAINPILYAYRMKDIRISVYKLFGVESTELSSPPTSKLQSSSKA